MVFMIVFILGAFFTCTTFERLGVRAGILIGATLNALGSVLKFAPGLQFPCFASMMVPQSINAVAQLFVLSTPPLLAAQYFIPDKRVFANAIASTANLLGSAAGLLIPALIVRDPERKQFETLFGLQMAMSCSVLVACLVLLKSPQRPQLSFTPPPQISGSSLCDVHSGTPLPSDECDADIRSPPEKSSETNIVLEVLHTIKILMQNRDFLYLLGAFSITTGSIWSVASVLAQIYSPFGISEQLAGISGAGNVVAGTVTAYLVGLWVDRYHQYKIPIVVCLCGSVCVATSLLVVMLRAEPDTNTIRICCVFLVIFAGVFQITAVPLCFEFAMEITYPIRESVPGALMMATSNLVSLIVLITASVIIGDDSATRDTAVYTVGLILGVSVLGLVSSCFTREILNRREKLSEDKFNSLGKTAYSTKLVAMARYIYIYKSIFFFIFILMLSIDCILTNLCYTYWYNTLLNTAECFLNKYGTLSENTAAVERDAYSQSVRQNADLSGVSQLFFNFQTICASSTPQHNYLISHQRMLTDADCHHARFFGIYNELLQHKDELLRHKDQVIEMQKDKLKDCMDQLEQYRRKVKELETISRSQEAALLEVKMRNDSLSKLLDLEKKNNALQRDAKSPTPTGLTVSFTESEDEKLPSLNNSVSRGSSTSVRDRKGRIKSWERFMNASEALGALTTLRNFGPAAMKTLQDCIRDGADVCYQSSDMDRPVLHTFIERRLVSCVEICLKTPHSIDYTITDNDGFTPLHLVARKSCSSPLKAVKILKLILMRLESQPLLDNVDWSQKSRNGFDFINIAADYESLSLFWPLVRTLPFFKNLTEALTIGVRVHETDWEMLGPDKTIYFDPTKGIRYNLFYSSQIASLSLRRTPLNKVPPQVLAMFDTPHFNYYTGGTPIPSTTTTSTKAPDVSTAPPAQLDVPRAVAQRPARLAQRRRVAQQVTLGVAGGVVIGAAEETNKQTKTKTTTIIIKNNNKTTDIKRTVDCGVVIDTPFQLLERVAPPVIEFRFFSGAVYKLDAAVLTLHYINSVYFWGHLIFHLSTSIQIIHF
eukprot:gene6265-4514_t